MLARYTTHDTSALSTRNEGDAKSSETTAPTLFWTTTVTIATASDIAKSGSFSRTRNGQDAPIRRLPAFASAWSKPADPSRVASPPSRDARKRASGHTSSRSSTTGNVTTIGFDISPQAKAATTRPYRARPGRSTYHA